MTESSEDKKERNTLDELQKIGPIILNCHRSERQRQSRAALELKAFCKFLANSYADGRKGASEMEDALRYVNNKMKYSRCFFVPSFLLAAKPLQIWDLLWYWFWFRKT